MLVCIPTSKLLFSWVIHQIGVVGEVHPKVLLAFDITEPVYLLEMDLKTLVSFTTIPKKYQPVPRFPSIVRDMALIVDAGSDS